MAALARVALSMVALSMAYGCTSYCCTSYGCACQEEHFDLIFSLNDTTGAGHIKVAELAHISPSSVDARARLAKDARSWGRHVRVTVALGMQARAA